MNKELEKEFIDRVLYFRNIDRPKTVIHNVVLLAPAGYTVTPKLRDYAKEHGVDIIQDPFISPPIREEGEYSLTAGYLTPGGLHEHH